MPSSTIVTKKDGGLTLGAVVAFEELQFQLKSFSTFENRVSDG